MSSVNFIEAKAVPFWSAIFKSVGCKQSVVTQTRRYLNGLNQWNGSIEITHVADGCFIVRVSTVDLH